MKELINLTIINDSDCTLSIPLFKNNVSSINATTKYQWDITSANISCGYGTIIVNGSVISIIYLPTLIGLVDSLNALNYGYFCTEVIGANTYIYTKDNTNVYGLLDLCAVSTTTTTTTTTAAPTTSTTTTTTTAAIFSCSTNDTTFGTSTNFNLGTTSGFVTITGSGLTAGDTYKIIYPIGGSTIYTTIAVDGSGNLNDSFTWTYDGVNTNVTIQLSTLP